MCARCSLARRMAGQPDPKPAATPHLDALVARLDAIRPEGFVPDPAPGATDHLPTFSRAPKPGRWP